MKMTNAAVMMGLMAVPLAAEGPGEVKLTLRVEGSAVCDSVRESTSLPAGM